MPESKPALFDRFARWIERQVGSPTAFCLAVFTVVLWGITGPLFNYSDTWQLAINTGTTIITFLMVFLIQGTQSRDTRAIHLKLDELIRVNKQARNSLMNVEDLSEVEIEEARKVLNQIVENKNPSTLK
jgi:low affinity Fe/Cu permease